MVSSASMATISASSSSPFSPHSNSRNPRRRVPPITISANPSHLDPLQLRDLLLSCNLSCDRFPLAGPCGRAEPVDARKLRRALAHSFVVVSVFCRARFLDRDDERDGPGLGLGFEELFERALPVSGSDHRLVGFGRAVSDGGLTASIHDVVVNPLLQRSGIGRKIVERIIRVLTSRGIYDISALCTEKERLFFKACGFGEDSLGSTTMMYTRTAPKFSQDNMTVRPAGRLLLLVPPFCRQLHASKKIKVHINEPKTV
uniref:N-acetyltransferase domain-containing protein n=1 Tax=Ananas comosus var. bracteatus TaxID=296719 RepID=A0A6V7NFT7_ANACO|nr:unnamed protein product [Ananas comosus var. bracteatus]